MYGGPHILRRPTFELFARTFLVLVFFLVLTTSAFGATEDFIVEQLVGGDVIPPSVPLNLTATPIATSQIDLAWDASTDNYLMGGYQLWRDDAFLATTTGTSYSDVGLTASTTYTYFVYAFDSFFNYSASSSPASTTTLPIPPPTPTSTPTTTDDGTQGSRIRPFPEQIVSLEVLSQRDSVVIRYETHGHIRSVIRWGRTSSYELGSLIERAFGREHETKITGLTPGTTYYFTIEGENKLGKYGVMHTGTFTTLAPDDVFPPGNVRELTATADGDDVRLSWVNPNDLDFEKVRIVRSDRFYPGDIADGWVVYEGDGESFRDEGILESGETQYYTIFTYDELGNISSGAVIAIGPDGEEAGPEVDPTKDEISLAFEDVLFAQDGIVLPTRNGEVRIDGAKQLTISIPYDRLPEHLKTILVVIREGEGSDRAFKFILRVNREKAFYTGTLAPFGKSGTFPVVVSVFDYKTAQVGYADGTILSRIESTFVAPIGFLEYLGALSLSYWYTILFMLLLVILGVLGHRTLSRES